MLKEYRTVEKSGFDEFVTKKSRFIGYVKPVTTAQQATDFINEIKSKHWDATHNVYAYVLKDGFTRRYSDDGEPQGTAGIPVLDVILKENLCDVAVVVTRYFGGILLGAGGLVRAYSHAAKIGIDSGKIITMSVCTVAQVECDYNFYSKLLNLLSAQGAKIIDTEFAQNVRVTYSIRSENFKSLNDIIFDQSCGKYLSNFVEEKFSAVN